MPVYIPVQNALMPLPVPNVQETIKPQIAVHVSTITIKLVIPVHNANNLAQFAKHQVITVYRVLI